MKRITTIFLPAICTILVAGCLVSCKKLAGLDLQENVPHPTSTIDPRINKTAWQWIKERSSGQPDSIFYQMYRAIIYSGIDTNEYTKPGRTYIILHNDAAIHFTGGKIDTATTYFGHYKIGPGPTAYGTKWEDYSPAQVKNWLLYLIVQGEYNYNFGSTINPKGLIVLTADLTTATTLLPPGTDSLNPQSIITFDLSNDRSSTVQLNNFLGSALATNIRTGGTIVTNGIAHVADKLVYYKQN